MVADSVIVNIWTSMVGINCFALAGTAGTANWGARWIAGMVDLVSITPNRTR
jgi:hypothetical protein